MTNKKMTPAEKLKASRKRYKKIWLQLDIANAKRFDEKEVLSVDTYRSSYETRKKKREDGRLTTPPWNITAKSKDDQDKVNVDLAASGVAYKERLNMPVVAEEVAIIR